MQAEDDAIAVIDRTFDCLRRDAQVEIAEIGRGDRISAAARLANADPQLPAIDLRREPPGVLIPLAVEAIA